MMKRTEGAMPPLCMKVADVKLRERNLNLGAFMCW